MHNPHNKTYLFVHVIWSVKYRQMLLNKPVRLKLYKWMIENAAAKNIHILIINGVDDHVHCLLQLHPTQNLSAVVQVLKGGSAFWLNQHKLLNADFKWQDGYAAYSVSPSMVKKVMRYIENQEEHHQSKSLADELNVMDDMNNLPVQSGLQKPPAQSGLQNPPDKSGG